MVSFSHFCTSVLSLTALLSVVSCAPSAFTMAVDLRHPSKSGLDLGGKTMSVVYVDDGDPKDSLFIASVSEGFARQLESDYFSGRRVLDIYRLDYVPGADYSSRDTLINILMDAGTDVVFLYDRPEFHASVLSQPMPVQSSVSKDSSFISELKVPYSLALHVYDSMNAADSVYTYTGSNTFVTTVYSDGLLPDSRVLELASNTVRKQNPAADKAGQAAARIFMPVWKTESVTVIYYETGNSWIMAANAASNYRWKEAMSIWMTLLDTKNLEKRSCAEYNIALACYVLGDESLALEWLDRSDSDYPLMLSYNLRKKIIS